MNRTQIMRDVIDRQQDQIAELKEELQDFEKKLSDADIALENCDVILEQNEILKAIISDWQKFAIDVKADCPAGDDWLSALKARSFHALRGIE